MLSLAAYADRLSVRPGETIHFHVANEADEATEVDLVRVVCADANPQGPGILLEATDARLTEIEAPTPMPVPCGSYAAVPVLPRPPSNDGIAIVCRIMPTSFGRERTVLHHHDGVSGWSLGLDARGHLCARVGELRLRTEQSLKLGSWAFVWLCIDTNAGLARTGFRSLHHGGPDQRPGARRALPIRRSPRPHPRHPERRSISHAASPRCAIISTAASNTLPCSAGRWTIMSSMHSPMAGPRPLARR
ncbi:MAG: hypothetical protein R3E83_17020 [Burkholderiaceae bacterium]